MAIEFLSMRILDRLDNPIPAAGHVLGRAWTATDGGGAQDWTECPAPPLPGPC